MPSLESATMPICEPVQLCHNLIKQSLAQSLVMLRASASHADCSNTRVRMLSQEHNLPEKGIYSARTEQCLLCILKVWEH